MFSKTCMVIKYRHVGLRIFLWVVPDEVAQSDLEGIATTGELIKSIFNHGFDIDANEPLMPSSSTAFTSSTNVNTPERYKEYEINEDEPGDGGESEGDESEGGESERDELEVGEVVEDDFSIFNNDDMREAYEGDGAALGAIDEHMSDLSDGNEMDINEETPDQVGPLPMTPSATRIRNSRDRQSIRDLTPSTPLGRLEKRDSQRGSKSTGAKPPHRVTKNQASNNMTRSQGGRHSRRNKNTKKGSNNQVS
ncbi:hypothetical protein GGR53DRAFT_464919 [Hypoxylon sp. FL1150]|nr:hypothetical protein GGR53DRAFT_464919 [Hypoxylon sp. FL1150]